MPEANDINRYSFHGSANEKAGVSPAFVHSQVIDPVESLLEKARKALSLKAGDPEYTLAVEILQNCGQALLAPLDIAKSSNNADANKASEPSAEPVSRTYGSSF